MATKTDSGQDINDFLVVDRLDQLSDKHELEAKIFSLKEEILYLKSWKNNCEKFQEKFFELFIAFTVLITPLAIAFVFNYLFSNDSEFNTDKDINCTSCPPEWIAQSKKDEELGENPRDPLCCLLTPQSPSSTIHVRDAVVPVLIAISCIVGLPYYYHMLEELSHNLKEYQEEKQEEDGDEDGAEDADEIADTVKEDDGDAEKKTKKSKDDRAVELKKIKEEKVLDVNLLSID